MNLKSRKLLVFAISFVVGVVLALVGKLDATTSDFIVYMTGAYLVANAGQKIVERFKK